MTENKRLFEAPECEIIEMEIVDVVTTSEDFTDPGNWGGGEI